MAFVKLPNDHIELRCDQDCGMAITGSGATEDDLLAEAEARGWAIDRDLGLAYCPLAVPHDCAVCGAMTRDSLGGTYLCDEHYGDALRELRSE